MKVLAAANSIRLSDESAAAIISTHGVTFTGNPSDALCKLGFAIYQDFENFYRYYQDEQHRAYYAEIAFLVYGLG